MLRNYSLSVFVICLLFLFSNAVPAQETNVNSLIAAASANTQKDALSNYTYQLHIFRRSKSQKTSWLYEAILPSRMPSNRICRHSLILIEKNEKPVPYELLSSNRRSAVKELETSELQADTAQPLKNAEEDGGYVTVNYTAADDSRKNFRVDLLSLLKVSHFSNPKKETINGREAYIIEFTADEKAWLPNTLTYFTKLRGYVWIDTKDKRIVQVEGFPLQPDNAKKTKAEDSEKEKKSSKDDVVFFFSQFRTREGYWFPNIIRVNFLNHPELQNGFAYDTEYNFEKYQHLSVEANGGSQE